MKLKYKCGDVLSTNNYGDFVVNKYVGKGRYEITFLQTGYTTTTKNSNLKGGSVKDRMLPTVCGVGILGDMPMSFNGIMFKDYVKWEAMLVRCYGGVDGKSLPSYEGCVVSDNFKYYPYFKEWFHLQKGHDQKGWHLDKDILVKGNKVYSEDTCCFVPLEINMLLTKGTSKKDTHRRGVFYHPKEHTYLAMCCINGKQKYLGSYPTEEEAFLVYKEAKENQIKEVAKKYEGVLDVKVFNTLMCYEAAW